MDLQIIKVDYSDEKQGADLCYLLNEYAKDPMGGGEALDKQVLNSLPAKLQDFPGATSFIAYLDDQPAGLVNGFLGFSTFKAQPLFNIHDFTVLKKYRGMKVSSQLMKTIDEHAKEQGCCKITLEVLNKNQIALQAYKNFGFNAYELDPETGQAIFMEKLIRP